MPSLSEIALYVHLSSRHCEFRLLWLCFPWAFTISPADIAMQGPDSLRKVFQPCLEVLDNRGCCIASLLAASQMLSPISPRWLRSSTVVPKRVPSILPGRGECFEFRRPISYVVYLVDSMQCFKQDHRFAMMNSGSPIPSHFVE